MDILISLKKPIFTACVHCHFNDHCVMRLFNICECGHTPLALMFNRLSSGEIGGRLAEMKQIIRAVRWWK